MSGLAVDDRVVTSEGPARAGRLRRMGRAVTRPEGAIYPIVLLLFATLIMLNPTLGDPGQFTRLLGRMAPIVIVAVGAYFVLIAGEFDLSIGAVIAAQVVIAGNYIGPDNGRIVPGLVIMVVLAVVVGAVNGLVTALLRVPGFITTLGTMLALNGVTYYVTGGAASQDASKDLRQVGRGGFSVPLVEYVPWSLVVLVVTLAAAAWLMRRPFGRLLLGAGDNPATTALAGVPVWWLTVRSFILSALCATLAAVLLVGFAGTNPAIGQGYQYTAIAAAVVGGVALGGGRGWVLSAAAGAVALETLVSILNALGIPSTWRDSVQGLVILAAVSVTAVRWVPLRHLLGRRAR